MEPYRPYVDALVVDMLSRMEVHSTLTPDLKRELLGIPALDVHIEGRRTPLMVGVSQTTASLAKCFSGEVRKIVYPSFPCSKV